MKKKLKKKETLDFYNAYEIPEVEKVDLFKEDKGISSGRNYMYFYWNSNIK